MMWVTFKIDGRFTCDVDTNDPEEAKKLALEKYYDANFGELECIDAEPIMAEDENGNYHDYD